MAQGFKPSKAGAKAKGAGASKKASGPKRGVGRVIAPKKKSAVDLASQKKIQTASLTRKIESDMAGRAAGGGPLSIMKRLGEEVNEAKQAEKEKKLAKAKAKGRAV